MLRNERRAQEARPSVHIRKVHTGRVGSSSFETVKQTSSTGETSFSSCFVAGSISRVVDIAAMALREGESEKD